MLYRELIRRGDQRIPDRAGLARSTSCARSAGCSRRRTPSRSAASIAFIGAKGGVGSSTIAHNVAWAIARDLKLDAVVADLDLAFGTAGLDFNQDPPQGIAEAVFSPERIDTAFSTACSRNAPTT